MATTWKRLAAVLVGGLIALASIPAQAGLATSPFTFRGPAGPAPIEPQAENNKYAENLAEQANLFQPPAEDEPLTFEEFLEMLFEFGAW